MTETATPMPPPDPNACEACRQPLADQHYRFGERRVCINCAGQLHALQERNRFALGPWTVALIVGVITALVCGAIWAAIAIATNYEIGIIAVGVGIVVGAVVVKAAGNRRGRSLQILAMACSVLGIIAGKGFLGVWMMMHTAEYAAYEPVKKVVVLVVVFFVAAFIGFGLLDVLWYFLAIRAAWQLAKAPAMQLHGPYATSAPPAPTGLQFDTVEPVQPPQVPR